MLSTRDFVACLIVFMVRLTARQAFCSAVFYDAMRCNVSQDLFVSIKCSLSLVPFVSYRCGRLHFEQNRRVAQLNVGSRSEMKRETRKKANTMGDDAEWRMHFNRFISKIGKSNVIKQ